MKKNILIFSLLLATSVSCKKYEEGPLISFRSAQHRILGDWKVVSYTVNGIDSMQYIYKNQMGGRWIFEKVDDYGVWVMHTRVRLADESSDILGGELNLYDHNKSIIFGITNLIRNHQIYNAADSLPHWKFGKMNSWEIIKLKTMI